MKVIDFIQIIKKKHYDIFHNIGLVLVCFENNLLNINLEFREISNIFGINNILYLRVLFGRF